MHLSRASGRRDGTGLFVLVRAAGDALTFFVLKKRLNIQHIVRNTPNKIAIEIKRFSRVLFLISTMGQMDYFFLVLKYYILLPRNKPLRYSFLIAYF